MAGSSQKLKVRVHALFLPASGGGGLFVLLLVVVDWLVATLFQPLL